MTDYVTEDQRRSDRLENLRNTYDERKQRAEEQAERYREIDPAEARFISTDVETGEVVIADEAFTDGLIANRQAWHGKARVYDEGGTEGIPIEVARRDPAVDFTVSKHPEYTFIPGYGLKPHTGKYAIVRDDTLEQFAVVGERFEPIQQEQAFQFMETLLATQKVVLESVLSLRGGKTVVLEARRPEPLLVAGEEFMDYFGIVNPHDGSGSLLALFTKERMVCLNTTNIAVEGAKAIHRIRHTAGAQLKLDEAIELLEISFRHTRKLKEFGEELAMQKVSDREFDDFLKSLVPLPEPEYGTTEEGVLYVRNQRAIDNRIATRESVKDNYMTSDNLGNIRGTAWGVFNAVTEWEQHIRSYTSTETRADNLMTGGDYARRAAALLTA